MKIEIRKSSITRKFMALVAAMSTALTLVVTLFMFKFSQTHTDYTKMLQKSPVAQKTPAIPKQILVPKNKMPVYKTKDTQKERNKLRVEVTHSPTLCRIFKLRYENKVHTYADEYELALTLTGLSQGKEKTIGQYFIDDIYSKLYILEIACFLQHIHKFPERKINFLNIEQACCMYIDIITSATAYMDSVNKHIHIISSIIDMLSIHSHYSGSLRIYACNTIHFIFDGIRHAYIAPYAIANNMASLGANMYANIQYTINETLNTEWCNIRYMFNAESIWCQCMISTSYEMLSLYTDVPMEQCLDEFIVTFFNTLYAESRARIYTSCVKEIKAYLSPIQHRLQMDSDALCAHTEAYEHTDYTRDNYSYTAKTMLTIIQNSPEVLQQYVLSLRACTPYIVRKSRKYIVDEQEELIKAGDALMHQFYNCLFKTHEHPNRHAYEQRVHKLLYDMKFKMSVLRTVYSNERPEDHYTHTSQEYYADLYDYLTRNKKLQHLYQYFVLTKAGPGAKVTKENTETEDTPYDKEHAKHYGHARRRLPMFFKDNLTIQKLLKQKANKNNVWKTVLENCK